MNAVPDPYQKLDTFETLKAHVLAHAPGLARELERLRGEPWRTMSPAEAQVEAVAVVLGLDRASAPDRRKARGVLRELLPPPEDDGRPAFGAVREQSPLELMEKLAPAAREALEASVAWIAAEPPAAWLSQTAGAHAAAVRVRRKAKALTGLRAWQWLAALGYDAAVPDRARQRVLTRLGWMEEMDATVRGREAAHRRMEELAHELGTPVAEFNVLLGAFAGVGDAREAARCTEKPRCEACPLAERCPYFAANRKAMQAPSRNLAATVRPEQRPRERLQARGAGALSDEELLAIVLRTGSGNANAVDLAHQLLRKAESLDRLAAMSIPELAAFPGMGTVKAVTVQAALELARRLRGNDEINLRPKMNGARRVFEHLRPRFTNFKKEQFYVLNLNTKLELIREVLVSTGTLNQSLVHPREVFAEAIRDAAHSVIFAHNHPTGDPAPSREDHNVTRKLVQAGEIIGIHVLDHVIIGADRFYSFADEGKLK
ncbi:MAG: repair protein RadC [Candidatus Sumerlaeota bacterium]|nr:repair protein RadC [Candidatus Sumerlaeota bacterium]